MKPKLPPLKLREPEHLGTIRRAVFIDEKVKIEFKNNQEVDMRRRTRQIREYKKNRKVWIKINTIATGFSFLFVFYIGFSIISAALFKRNEVNWNIVLPPLIILLAFIPMRIIIMNIVNKK